MKNGMSEQLNKQLYSHILLSESCWHPRVSGFHCTMYFIDAQHECFGLQSLEAFLWNPCDLLDIAYDISNQPPLISAWYCIPSNAFIQWPSGNYRDLLLPGWNPWFPRAKLWLCSFLSAISRIFTALSLFKSRELIPCDVAQRLKFRACVTVSRGIVVLTICPP